MTSQSTDGAGRLSEMRAFLAANPDIAHVDGVLPDLCGVVRGKRYPRARAASLFEHGYRIPYSTVFLDVTGRCGDPLGRGFSDGDPDVLALPVPGTLVPTPWSSPPGAQVLMRLHADDGAPAASEPSNVAGRVLERLDALGLRARVAFELEFHLLDPALAADGSPRPAATAGGETGEDGVQVYGVRELERHGVLIDAFYRAGEAQGIPLSVATSEYGPAQFELNLDYCDDALRAADHSTLLRHLVRSVAEAHGLRATFMSKPFAGQAGNGMHLHVSMLDARGDNVFAHASPAGSETMRHAAGGALDTMYDAMAIFAPNPNAYRRFAPDYYVPVNRTWAPDNRSCALRIPGGPPASRRIEHRVAGADANAYLVLAAVLAGMHHGISGRIDPGEPATDNVCSTLDPAMPLDWPLALDRLDESARLRDYLGGDYVDLYCATKRAERAHFMEHVSAREIAWYL